jgi:hypothetical protein
MNMTDLAFTAVPQPDRQVPSMGTLVQSLSTVHDSALSAAISFWR